MRILLLGVGQQGRVALHDLAGSASVDEVVAADLDLASLEAFAGPRGYGPKVRCRRLDASDRGALAGLIGEGFDVVIDLLPSPFTPEVAALAVRSGVHLVDTNFVPPALRVLAGEAEGRGVTILPEFGMDPGIDLVLLGEAVREFDTVTDLLTYGAGIPEPAASDNPLRYKVSWSLEGVLRAYHRGARLVRDGAVVDVGPRDQFLPEHVHAVEVEGVGALEAYPNGDAVQLGVELGLDPARMRTLGRYSMRYPGHSRFWATVAALHLLDDEPVVVDGVPVDRKRYLAAALGPQLRYGATEGDLAIILIEVAGTRAGRREKAFYRVVERRDPATGFSAMGRLVGFTASVGAQMIGDGRIARRGLLSPTKNVPFESFVSELERRGIRIARK